MKYIPGGWIKTDNFDDYVYVSNSLIQVLSPPVTVDDPHYEVGLAIVPNYGTLLIISPGLAVPLNKSVIRNLEDCEIYDSSPQIESIEGVYD